MRRPNFAREIDLPSETKALLPPWPIHACEGALFSKDAAEYIDALWANALGIVGAFPKEERDALKLWVRTLFPHQLDLVFDPWQYSILNKSRKIGATYSYAGAACLWAMLGDETIMVSETQDVADRFIRDVVKHSEMMCAAGSNWAVCGGNKSEVVFPNTGGRVIARPATNAGRGFSGNVLLDEFAYHADAEAVWDAASAVATMGKRIRIFSTPNGVGNLFHRFVTDPRTNEGYRVMQMTLEFARTAGYLPRKPPAEGPPTDADTWVIARGDPRVHDQLFGCAFLDSDEQYLPHAIVSAASIATMMDFSRLEGLPRYAGVDIARKHDLFAVVTAIEDMSSRCVGQDGVERGGPVLWIPPAITCRRTNWIKQRQIVKVGFGEQKWKRLCVDAGGLGMETAERMQRRHGSQRVELVTFGLAVKEDLATRLFEWFWEGRIRLLREDAEMRADLYALRRMITTAGNIRYDAARTKDGHADRAWALALACLAAARSHIGRDDDGNTHGDTMRQLMAVDNEVYAEQLDPWGEPLEDEGDDYEPDYL